MSPPSRPPESFADLPPMLTVAHRMPGRVRLRWHGPGAPPPAVLTAIEALPGVRHIEYRPESRSIILRHVTDPASHSRVAAPPRAEAVRPQAASLSGVAARARWVEGDRERWVRVLEDLLTVGLVGAWVLDLALGGAGGAAIPVLVGLMMGLAVYRVWRRRRPARRGTGEDLMVLRSA